MTGDVVVSVDPGMCMGVQSCIRVAPRSFAIDDANTAHGVPEPPDDLETLVEAAAACPNFAITVAVDGEVVFDPETQ